MVRNADSFALFFERVHANTASIAAPITNRTFLVSR